MARAPGERSKGLMRPSAARSRTRRSALHIVGATFLLLCPACSPDGPDGTEYSRYLQQILESPERIVAGADTTNVDGLLANPYYARILHGHNGFLVSDRAPPFLRVFDTNGKLLSSALRRGDGPGEARGVLGIGVSPHNRIMVAADRGVQEFSLTDDSLHFVMSYRWPNGLEELVTFAAHCDREWLAYTPHRVFTLQTKPFVVTGRVDPSDGIQRTG